MRNWMVYRKSGIIVSLYNCLYFVLLWVRLINIRMHKYRSKYSIVKYISSHTTDFNLNFWILLMTLAFYSMVVWKGPFFQFWKSAVQKTCFRHPDRHLELNPKTEVKYVGNILYSKLIWIVWIIWIVIKHNKL